MENDKLYDEEDEFCSCCGEENDEESLHDDENDVGDEKSTVEMYLKGVSVDGVDESGSGLVGIGVVFDGLVVCCVQKRLDFYVESLVSEYLALIDGLIEVSKNNNAKRVVGFTDSKLLYEQVMHDELQSNPLISALKDRVLELTTTLEAFTLELVPSLNIERASQLARVAIGLVSLDIKAHDPHEKCSICCKNKPSSFMLTLRCSHKFCSHCLKTHTDGKIRAGQVLIKCPQSRCEYSISISECKAFLPLVSYEVLKRKNAEHSAVCLEKLYCPYENCSALVDRDGIDNNCIECRVCERSICVNCVVPMHDSLSCEECRDGSDVSLYQLARDRRWKRCRQCWRMIELTHGCYHLICWCGHEFCYFCGYEYRDGRQTCECALYDEYAYSDQEHSQLALIQTFLAGGGFGLSDHSPHQSPSRCMDSYVDAMKDIHQLPWLERFVSVISDNYYDDYFH